VKLNDLPTVSIVVASYNHSIYLRRRLDSLLGQTYQNIEIIVIDDCSTENNRDILDEYKGFDNIKIFFNKTNEGWVKVSNRGVSYASGDYVIWANCDDFCAPNMIERLILPMQNDPSIVACFCRSYLIDGEDVIVGDDYSVRELAFKRVCTNDVKIIGDLMSAFLYHSCVMPNLSAVLFRKNILFDVGLHDASYVANSDWDLFIKLAKIGDFYYVSEPLNYFRQHVNTIRNKTKNLTTYKEYFHLLLSNVNYENASNKFKIRVRVGVLLIRYLFVDTVGFIYNMKDIFQYLYGLDRYVFLFIFISPFYEIYQRVRRGL
jgi:glycosyltransferase involved in cell wall biosynthesis